MCIGVRITNNIGEKYRPIEMKYLKNRPIQNNSVILQKEYTSLKLRELEGLPRFGVMSWQPF